MIQAFADRSTEKFWEAGKKRGDAAGEPATHRPSQTRYAERCRRIGDLEAPPGNRLEQLTGDRKGQWLIRTNDQFRVCFAWRDGNAYDVEIVDYH